jgi:hypothetical protein
MWWTAVASCADSLPPRGDLDQREPVRDTIFSGREVGRGYSETVEPPGELLMPTDASAGDGGDSQREDTRPDRVDDLVFAAHDLGRDRAPRTAATDDELGFAPAKRPVEGPPAEPVGSFVPGGRDAPVVPAPFPVQLALPPSSAPADGFVIREPQGVAPVAPVDTLVVGAPTAAHEVAPTPAVRDHQSFRISATGGAGSDLTSEQLWTVRDPSPSPVSTPSASALRRGWSTRPSQPLDHSAQATMLRLREEAVHVSWKAAWIAVTAADPRLSRRRDF